jgi:hypothetical protein
MQIFLASVFLATTIAYQYGYLYLPWNSGRVFYALGGVNLLAALTVIADLASNRWTNRWALAILAAAVVMNAVEGAMIATCGTWFITYQGNATDNLCYMMTGFNHSRPFVYALVIVFLGLVIPCLRRTNA